MNDKCYFEITTQYSRRYLVIPKSMLPIKLVPINKNNFINEIYTFFVLHNKITSPNRIIIIIINNLRQKKN